MRTKISKKEEASMDAYLRTHAKKPLQKIFTKLEEDKVLPIGMNVHMKNGDTKQYSNEDAVAELAMHNCVVIPGAKFKIDDIRVENGLGLTPYDFALVSQIKYDNLIEDNLEKVIYGLNNEHYTGVKAAFEDFKDQLNHITSHNKDIISGLLCSSISKLNISAVIEIFHGIYKKYPEKKDVIAKALAYVLHDEEIFNLLFIEKDNIGGRRRYIPFNPQIDSHISVNDTLYTVNPRDEHEALNIFMDRIELKLGLTATELTAKLYDVVFKILAKIELSTHGIADLGYEWIMESLDVIGFDVFATYHDSVIDMLKTIIIKLNAIMYNHGAHRELEQTLSNLLHDVNCAYNTFDDEYYE